MFGIKVDAYVYSRYTYATCFNATKHANILMRYTLFIKFHEVIS